MIGLNSVSDICIFSWSQLPKARISVLSLFILDPEFLLQSFVSSLSLLYEFVF